MIPFARMIKYGQLRNAVIIKKYYRSSLTGAAIDNNNGLWYLGYNAYGGAGDGTTSADYTNWKFIRNDVTNYWTNGGSGTSVIRTIDGKIYWCGNNAWLIGSSNGTVNTSWSEITFLSNKDIRNMQIGPNYIIAQIGTELYAFGVNAGGIFNGTSVVANGAALNTWTRISSTYNVKHFSVSSQQCYIVTTANVFIGCGTNASNCLSTTGLNNVLSWVTVLSSVSTFDDSSYPYKGMLNANISYSSGVYGRGSGTNNQFGNNSTATLTAHTSLNSYWPNYSNINKLSFSGSDSGGSANCLYVVGTGSNTQIYAMGGQSYGELGVGDQVIKSTPVLVPISIDEDEIVIGIMHSYGNSTTLYTNKRVLSCGRTFNGAAYVNVLTFMEQSIIPSDWIFDFDIDMQPWN